MTALLLEKCCGMKEGVAKAEAAKRWCRNLRSVQRYAEEHRRLCDEWLLIMSAMPWDEEFPLADYYRLRGDEGRQIIEYLLSRQK